jgi:hypothetical protein
MKLKEKMKGAITQVVQETFEKKGGMRASELVEAAKPKKSPIHDAFTWDDAKAGEEYRLIEARLWLRTVEVTVIKEEVPQNEILVHVAPADTKDGREGIYKPVSVVVETPDEFERALDEAQQRVASAKRAVTALESAAARSPNPERLAMIAQVARGLSIMEEAISVLH